MANFSYKDYSLLVKKGRIRTVADVKTFFEKELPRQARTQKGWLEFPDGKRYYFKSKWEMNYARYSQWLKEKGEIQDWQYEPCIFYFDGIRRGITNYKPDFLHILQNEKYKFFEIKGYLDAESKTKLKRMQKYYPHIDLTLIDKEQYLAICKMGALFGFE